MAVVFDDPASDARIASVVTSRSRWWRETDGSSRQMSQPPSRPTLYDPRPSSHRCPEQGPPVMTSSAAGEAADARWFACVSRQQEPISPTDAGVAERGRGVECLATTLTPENASRTVPDQRAGCYRKGRQVVGLGGVDDEVGIRRVGDDCRTQLDPLASRRQLLVRPLPSRDTLHPQRVVVRRVALCASVNASPRSR